VDPHDHSAAPGCPKDAAPANTWYSTPQAIEECCGYRLEPAEEYFIEKYFRPCGNVLDLACGLGRTTLCLHERGYPVVGVDSSALLIETARRRFPYLDFRLGSFACLDLPDACFSQVLISSNALDLAETMAEREEALRECSRALKPGGVLLYSCHNLKALHFFSPRYWTRPCWKLPRVFQAFASSARVTEGELVGIYLSPEKAIEQTVRAGFVFLESVGHGMRQSRLGRRYGSYAIHYAFRKPS
jgi:SAM-dependent methyltransferase